MKLPVILISFLLVFTFLNQSFAEVYTTGSAADNNDSIIVIGYCLGNVVIGGEQFNITTPSSFIIKLDSEGDVLWIKILSSSQSFKVNAVAIDSSGNFYLTGEFSGTANLGSYTLTAQGTDLFIVKCDVQGNVIWAKKSIGTGTESGRDIALVSDQIILVCGNSNSFTYDNLSVGSGGFTLKTDSEGNGIFLIQTLYKAHSISIDGISGFILSGNGYSTQPPFPFEFSIIAKYDTNGTNIWNRGGLIGGYSYAIAEQNSNVYSADSYYSLSIVRLFRLNPAGVPQSNAQLTNCFINKIISGADDNIIVTGLFNNNCNFNDSILISSGLQDAVIASVDTGFNVSWIKSGGGLFSDEFGSSALLNNGSIISCVLFRGQINFDNYQMSGGLSANDQWAALIKFDIDGNILWFKKIAENFSISSTINWFPLEAGNKWQYFDFSRYYPITYQYSLVNMTITDSININNTKYYKASNFFNFPSGTLIRYDEQTQRIIILKEGIEYTFVDFSKMEGETYQQIQPDNSFLQVEATVSNIVVFNDTILTKGFYRETNQIYGYYNFAENIGLVDQDEERILLYTNQHDYDIIEYVLYNPEYFHNKHQQIPSIQFQPISFIPESSYLNQNFKINHRYSILTNSPSYIYGFSYIKNSYIQSFYFNGADTIWNNIFNIPQTTEIDFSLNYQFDTTKYNQGYHLYYRIAAVDKGIIADTFYSPQTGYYKLFWKDSTTSVTQTEFVALTYSLSQNYPNPFNPVSKIVFTIPKRENVSLKVYDILGSEIATLVNKELDAGKYDVEFSGKDLSSGIYIYQLKAGAFRETKKMMLLK